MRQIRYHAMLEGRSASLAGAASEGTSFSITAAAKHDQIGCLEGAQHLGLLLQASLRNEVSFEARATAERDGALRCQGRIRFGDDDHTLTVSTTGEGRLVSAAEQRQGAATLSIDGGTGMFAGATGLITSNFLLDASGVYRDQQTAVISLPGKAAATQGPAPVRIHVRDVLNEKAIPVTSDATMEYVADLMALTEFSEQMVVDRNGQFVGVLSETDLLRALIPDLDEIIKAGGSLDDAMRIFFQLGEDLAAQPVGRLVRSLPCTISPDDELLAVATVMLKSHTRRLPVVKNGAFLGTISLTDICWAVLSRWNGLKQQ